MDQNEIGSMVVIIIIIMTPQIDGETASKLYSNAMKRGETGDWKRMQKAKDARWAQAQLCPNPRASLQA